MCVLPPQGMVRCGGEGEPMPLATEPRGCMDCAEVGGELGEGVWKEGRAWCSAAVHGTGKGVVWCCSARDRALTTSWEQKGN